MALCECWSCLDTRQGPRPVCRAPVGNSYGCPPQVEEAFSTFFYEMCNYYGRQGCGFKPSQYVDKRYTHTDTAAEKGCCCMRNIKSGCQNPLQVGRKPCGPVEGESDGRNETFRKLIMGTNLTIQPPISPLQSSGFLINATLKSCIIYRMAVIIAISVYTKAFTLDLE